MKIFISWSGPRSHIIAETLRTWLTDVIHLLEPWISSQDIDKGVRWASNIAGQLEESRIGIICITKENIDAPWILFEAGALAKTLERTFVCTYLLDVKPIELKGPLVQFQATIANEDDTLRMLRTINKALGEKARSNEQLEKAFRKWWPELKKAIDDIPHESSSLESLRSDRDMLEEILDLIRSQVIEAGRIHGISNILVYQKGSLAEVSQDKSVRSLANSIHLDGKPDDPNASEWTNNVAGVTQDCIDGPWFSRWNWGEKANKWIVGTAKLQTIGEQVYIFFSDNKSTYIIAAQREADDRLVGRYFNLIHTTDSKPWVGLIVSPERIDGEWSQGRWDFRRTLDPN
jgi:hypothetical protein